MEERKAEVLARLEAKHAVRLAKAEARREESDSHKDPSQTPTVFWATFSRSYDRVRPEMDKFRSQVRVEGVNDANRPEFESRLSDWAVLAQDLQKSIADATLYLPPYDVRQAQGQVAELKANIDALRADIVPRKKFTFKSRARRRAKAAGESTSDDTGDQATPSAASADAGEDGKEESKADGKDPMALYMPEEYGIDGKTGEEVVIKPGDLREGQDIRLAELTDCTIVLKDAVRAVRADNLTNCHVYTGPIAGSVLAHNCTNCVFHLASRQIRLHTSKDCDFYLHVKSRPIIEDCAGLRFAPYSVTYPELDGQLEAAGLPPVGSSDMWAKVDDFKWHRIQHSPNWAVLPDIDRLRFARTQHLRLSHPAVPRPAAPAPAPAPAAAPAAPAPAGGGDDDDDSDDDEL